MTSRSAFRCAGRGPAVTHPRIDPAKSCLTWVIAWHRTPITHRTLSVAKYMFLTSLIWLIFQIFYISRSTVTLFVSNFRLGSYTQINLKSLELFLGWGLEQSNVEWPIFRDFVIPNIKRTKDEIRCVYFRIYFF